MVATRFVYKVFSLLGDDNFSFSEGKQSDFKGERICGYLSEASLNFLLWGNREEMCLSLLMKK